jgi:acetylxylan esterase
MYLYTPIDPPSRILAQIAHITDPALLQNRFVYVPDQVKTDALVVAIHSCGSTGPSYFGWAPWKKGSDSKGYVTVFPSATSNCWDVSSKASLSRNGGGESTAIADMIKYAISKYKINPKKVFVVGESSGAMMSNVLASTYPDLIAAVSMYSGVPAGCFVSASGATAAWNGDCAGGRSIKTAQQWGDIVRAMYPGYTGARPRMRKFFFLFSIHL